MIPLFTRTRAPWEALVQIDEPASPKKPVHGLGEAQSPQNTKAEKPRSQGPGYHAEVRNFRKARKPHKPHKAKRVGLKAKKQGGQQGQRKDCGSNLF